MSRFVIYSCITDNYDTLEQPCEAPEWVDFILFVPPGKKYAENDGVWKIEELPISWDDKIITSRFPKLSPQSVLEGYEYSLWIDGNIRITSTDFYDICKDLISSDVKYAGIKHPFRDCAYDETERILKDDREKLFRLLHIVRFLKSNGLPRHFGLMENNIIFRKHNDPLVLEFDRLWQERYVVHSPRRDQLVHSLCLMDVPDLKPEYLLPDGISVRNSQMFEYKRHPSTKLSCLQRKWKFGRLWPARILLHLYLKTVK